MKKVSGYILGSLVFSTLLYSAVPYSFKANTKAKASEVNSNFNSLDNRIITLENNITNIMNSSHNEKVCDISEYEYTYNQVQRDIGDTFTVGNIKYIMVAMPFIEFGTKEHYYVKYPVPYNEVENKISYTVIECDFVKQGNDCYTQQFDSYPAQIGDIEYKRRYEYPFSGKYKVRDSIGLSAKIKINQTVVTLRSYYIGKDIQSIETNSNDLRTVIDWTKLESSTQEIENIKQLMNYVDIVKVGS